MSTNAYFDLNTNEIIHQIIYLVKHKNNYNLAANFLLDNNLSIDELSKKTIKLSLLEIAKLTDSIIECKKLRK